MTIRRKKSYEIKKITTYHITSFSIQTQKYPPVQSWTSPGSNTPQDTNCTDTCPLSRNLFKLGEPDMQDIAGEAEMNS